MSASEPVAAARPLERSPIVRVVALTGGAFIVYGAWAMFVNSAHGLGVATRAFLVQGASSAFSTLLLTSVIEWVLARTRHALRWLLAALVPPTLTAAMHVAGHLLNATPRLGVTVAVPVAMGYVFAALYVWARWRQQRAERMRESGARVGDHAMRGDESVSRSYREIPNAGRGL